jgi:hypothetical protein
MSRNGKGENCMSKSKLALVLASLGILAVAIAASAAASSAPANLPAFDPSNVKPMYTHVGGADPLVTDLTVPHWFNTYVDGSNGKTYGYNMVGVDPATNATSTVPVDIIPLNISFAADGGFPLNGTDVVPSTVASPIFQSNDYSTVTDSTSGAGPLSAANVGQYEDAIMRSQFNKVGSAYHLNFGTPNVWAPVTFNVPRNQGFIAGGDTFLVGLVNVSWFSGQLNNLMKQLNLDPTHLPIFLTNNTMLYIGPDPSKPGTCCIIGYHGAAHSTGSGTGRVHSNSGSQPLQTFAYAAYTAPGTFGDDKDPATGGYWIKDIHALSHEIAEWGDDPFVNNAVNPWLTPTAPQYGCTGVLETGDPVVGIGFKIGTNTFDTTIHSDGGYHPEDEVFLPWFARTSPNTTSQAIQGGTNGRYTFMGNLNPFPGFRSPATGC